MRNVELADRLKALVYGTGTACKIVGMQKLHAVAWGCLTEPLGESVEAR
jgi:hypothetical protein